MRCLIISECYVLLINPVLHDSRGWLRLRKIEMSNYKNPPEFNSKVKPYDRYIEELKAWSVVTELDEEKQGLAIAFSLLEHDPSNLREKVFNEVTLNNLNNANGVKTLIEYLNGLFLRDELTVVYERYVAFDLYFKEATTKIEDYILEFIKLYNRVSQKDMTLPPPVLAFRLLDSVKLSHHDRQLALTEVDYSQKNTLFTQMKNSLCKFHGAQAIPHERAVKTEKEVHFNKYSNSRNRKYGNPILLHEQHFHHLSHRHYNKTEITNSAFRCKTNIAQLILPVIMADQSNVKCANLYSI